MAGLDRSAGRRGWWRRGDARVRVSVVGSYTRACPAASAVVLADRRWRPGAPRRGVLVCHPAGQLARDQRADWWPVPRALAASGTFVCLACDLGDPAVAHGTTSGPHSWGNDHALERLTDAHRFLMGARVGAAPGPVLLAGTSMGALVALNWARRHRAEVSGVLIACPVLGLRELYEHDRAGLAPSVAAAYGAPPAGPVPGLAEHDPAGFAPELAGLPIRIYASADDDIASDTASCRRWAEAVGGGAVSVVDLGRAGHWPVGTPTDDALAFAAGV